MKISTENIASMPKPDELLGICKAIALLDAILQPVWDLRYFSFNSKWADGGRMASMRDSSGEAYFMVFKAEGALLLAQTPHSPTAEEVFRLGKALPGTFDNVPPSFKDVLDEPAFSVEETTFCLWRQTTDDFWNVGGETSAKANHSDEVLFALDGKPETYQEWAEEYFETDVSLEVVRKIYRHDYLTQEMVQTLNPEMTLEKLAEDLDEIGYPQMQPPITSG